MANKYIPLGERITWVGYKTPINDANLNHMESRLQNISNYLENIQKSGMLIGKGVVIGDESENISENTYLSILDSDIAIAQFDSSDIKLFNNTTTEIHPGYKPLLHIHLDENNANNDFISFKGTKLTARDIELPQEWVEINEAYEAIGEDDHKLKGGAIYKDFDGTVKVFPLAPPYGVRTDECGAKMSSIAMYNSTQQLMVKPATDGRHTVSAAQLARIFGSGKDITDEKSFDLKGVILPTAQEYGDGYCFARNPYNTFTAKGYSAGVKPGMLVARDDDGNFQVPEPTKDANPVGLGYVNNKFLSKSGGFLSGRLTSKIGNPYFSLIDTQDNSSQSYMQAYRGKTYMGYSVAKSISVDKEGNAGVVGGLTVGGSVSCGEPKEDTDAVTLGYLNEKITEIEEYIKSLS